MTFNDCWASVGQVTFYHRDGECFWRKKAIPQFKGSPSQMVQQSVHSRALQAWKGLPCSVQELWNAYAKNVVSHRPPFLNDHHISGHNLFVSSYHGFARLGCEQIPTPKPFEIFPQLSCDFHSAKRMNESDLVLRLKTSLGSCNTPNRYRLAVRVQLTKVGAGKRPGYMRTFIAGSNFSASDDIVDIVIPDYRKVWNFDLVEYQVHMRYFLLDTYSGFRNQYKETSFSMVL